MIGPLDQSNMIFMKAITPIYCLILAALLTSCGVSSNFTHKKYLHLERINGSFAETQSDYQVPELLAESVIDSSKNEPELRYLTEKEITSFDLDTNAVEAKPVKNRVRSFFRFEATEKMNVGNLSQVQITRAHSPNQPQLKNVAPSDKAALVILIIAICIGAAIGLLLLFLVGYFISVLLLFG